MKEQVLNKKEFDEKISSLNSNEIFSVESTKKGKTIKHGGILYRLGIEKSISSLTTLEAVFADQQLDRKAFLKKCSVNGDTDDEIAYKELKLIFKAINGGAKIDFNHVNQKKWYGWFEWNESKSAFVFSYGLRLRLYGYGCRCPPLLFGRKSHPAYRKIFYASYQPVFILIYYGNITNYRKRSKATLP